LQGAQIGAKGFTPGVEDKVPTRGEQGQRGPDSFAEQPFETIAVNGMPGDPFADDKPYAQLRFSIWRPRKSE
jgi:hypothetical protein